ncbi:glycosyltransferase family 2 protein [Chitinimonas koreensis]|uniref:glycosyltransferase family 2 protein n=1 Tax=Chitinimonas koreensis TaxID=356302 RepID=UPI000413FAFA|nr:glycosyltransferase family 2 protein [Chitinimonas koreensis]QNM96457.1 glycosyltransferase family 2 protein [Chitinimonas koreensis]
MRIGLLIPTLNAGPRWHAALRALSLQDLRPDRLLLIDSGSQDGTVEAARAHGFEIVEIHREQFDHGATRQLGLDRLADCDVVICMTQDAIAAAPDTLSKLAAGFADGQVAVAWGRQLPHDDANPIAAHARRFNYPGRSRQVRSQDIPTLGIKAAFCSNSFAAWRQTALRAIGGFPSQTLLGEDMLSCAKLLQAGWTSAYVAEAAVHHSHNYSATEEFRRYFDTGVLHSREAWLIDAFGRAEGEGLRFIRSEWQALAEHGSAWRLKALLNNAAKFSGYALGRRYQRLPKRLVPRLSMHPRWWRALR